MKVPVVFCAVLAITFAENYKINWPLNHLEPRIAGGEIATPHEFPYQIGLHMKHWPRYEGDRQELFIVCGGVLISERFVLSAAHCLIISDKGRVFIGSHNLFFDKESEHQVMYITYKDWVVHPENDPINLKNDLGIIRLPKSAILSDKVKIINLPRRDQGYTDIEGHYAIASGWGRTGDNAMISSLLRFANLRVLSPTVCRLHYLPNFFTIETNICVSGSGNKSTCPGDSGGPLTITERNGEKTLMGLTSFGDVKGCEKGYPTAFTRVSSYLDWISSVTGIKIKN